jgi:hypothetical protein
LDFADDGRLIDVAFAVKVDLSASMSASGTCEAEAIRKVV